VSPKDFGEFDIEDAEDHLTDAGIMAARLTQAEPGSILIVVRSGILKHTIPVAINTRPVAVNQDVKVIVPNALCDARYLGWYLKVFERQLLPLITKHSTTVQSINTSEFGQLMIPLPPVEKQRSLAAEMDKARAERRAKLADAAAILAGLDDFLLATLGLTAPPKTDRKVFAIKYSALQGRLDPKTYLYRQHATQKTFAYASLGSLTRQEPDYGSGSRAVERTSDEQPKYIRITDFGDDGIPPGHEFLTAETIDPECFLENGDVLFARSGATAGKTFIYTKDIGPAVFAGYCIRFRFDESRVLRRFIYYFTKTSAYRQWVASIQRPSGQPNINKPEFKSLELPIPPLEVQQAVVKRLDAERKKAEELRADAEAGWQTAKRWLEEQLLAPIQP
jgi:restriction endonuclease S subunit